MTRLSPHFVRAEFACKCGCGFDTVDIGTLEILEAVRTHFGQPVTITSGCRCANHNRRVGGASNSQHVFGRAADIQVRNVSPSQVADWVAANFPAASIGCYRTFTHIDTRSNGPARWGG
ncbi:DUF882 domain-containing protein [Halomonas daqingensis]|uniref:D-Ala-D-Ala carboxypeptidase family metallohydrolase n=1 Tax=Billgrantia desiderata TaxID=52021 RepID=UPI001F3A2205|nr:D-Ala-D-Ala carboxypeptidase family metallohydrolase [Halomonas desiderata]MCE8027526.1 DUF882 domain-containing protein [Halomonas desiderata]